MNAENDGLIKLEEITNILHKALNDEQQDLCIEIIRGNFDQLADTSDPMRERLTVCEGIAELLHKKYNTEETKTILDLIMAKKKELGFDFYDCEPNLGDHSH